MPPGAGDVQCVSGDRALNFAVPLPLLRRAALAPL